MPITDYRFQDRVFSAREAGTISADEAKEWADKLQEYARQSSERIVALVDAVEVKNVTFAAQQIFSKASYTPNVMAVVVVTNNVVGGTATNISLLGKRQQTVIFRTFDEANAYIQQLFGQDTKRKQP